LGGIISSVAGIGWVNETRLLTLTNTPRSTFRGWTKAGTFEQAADGAYGEGEVIELALLAELRNHLTTDDLASAWSEFSRSGELEQVVNWVRRMQPGNRLDLVVEPRHAGLTWARDDPALVAAVRHPMAPRPVVVVDVAERLVHIRDSFRRTASRTPRPAKRSAGRPSRAATRRDVGSSRTS
jgi:hypothetical protein